MRALFKRFATGGRLALTAELFHEASKQEGIWQFRKGRIRVFCFLDGANLVLTHAAIKKSQKADKRQVAEATRRRNEYILSGDSIIWKRRTTPSR